tara:strand:+ start:431 stop:652 length:222 start_codon:yes stop_codon:yes gene_type:complete
MVSDGLSHWEYSIMKYTSKNNPIAKQLRYIKYRNRIVPSKKHSSKGAKIEDWEDGKTEQDTRATQNVQFDDED